MFYSTLTATYEKPQRNLTSLYVCLGPESGRTRIGAEGWLQQVGDINVTMRLRDWRPMGEVIAPLVVRQQMMAEAQQELAGYGAMGL